MKRWLAAVGLAILFVPAACRRSDAPPPQPLLDDSKARIGGTLHRRLDADVSTLNPVIATSRYERLVDGCIFTPMINLDENLRPIAGLAETWDISADGRDYTFHLNPKATFSDGIPVKASDVLFTLRKIADPQSEAAQLASSFESLEMTRSRVIDDHTVFVAFREPLASQLLQFNNVLVLPEHVYAAGDFKTAFNSQAVGSGPYKLVRRDPGKSIVLERRKDYWGETVYPETVEFKVIVNNTTAWNAVRRGDVDETYVPSDIWAHEKADPFVIRLIEWHQFYGLSYNYIAWNGRDPLFSDKRVRRALGMCLDVRTVISSLYSGTARAMSGPFTPEQMGFNPDVPVLPYDPEGARQIFTSLGWLDTNADGVLDRDGKPFHFEMVVLAGNPSGLAIMQMFQAALKNVGVQMDLSILDPAVGIQQTLSGNYQAAYLSWDLDPDPDPYALFDSAEIPPRGLNFVYYANPAADKLIEAARREMKPSRRADLYQQLHAMLADDQPYTWTIQPTMKWAVNKRVKGVRESKGYGLFQWYPGELGWWLGRNVTAAGLLPRG